MIKYFILLLNIFFIINNTSICFSQSLPIKPDRTISFSTNEGSYMNVDISPDGEMLLFDLLGDIFSVSIKGGEAKQLTRGIALNLRPTWSPNGESVAYISDNSGVFQINIRDIQGKKNSVLGEKGKEINYGQDLIWFPDGKYILVQNTLVSVDGESISILSKIRHPLRFSTNGQFLFHLDSNRLFRYDFKTELSEAFSDSLESFKAGVISPDGKWWCYITDSLARRCLVLLNLEDKNSRILVQSLSNPSYEAKIPAQHFTFSPNSKSVIIAYGGKIHKIDLNNGNDQIIPFVANVKSDLGSYNYNSFRTNFDSGIVKYTRSGNLSPDGKHLIFSALNRLYEMDIVKGTCRVVTEQPYNQYYPIYSPNGKWICFVSWCDTLGGFVWKIPSTGGIPEKITTIAGQYHSPTWSPEGKFIAIIKGGLKLGTRDGPGNGELHLINVEEKKSRTIDENVPLWNQLSFSQDGTKIFYRPKRSIATDGSLARHLISRNLEGEDEKLIAIGQDLVFVPVLAKMSPDEKYLVYSIDEDLYLLPIGNLDYPYVLINQKQALPAIKFGEGVDFNWEDGGKIVSWSYGNKFHRVSTKKILETADKINSEGTFVSVNLTPDETINLIVKKSKFYGQGIIALTNATVITMKGSYVVRNGTVVIKDGRIISIGETSNIRVPKTARIIDLRGYTIMPGIIDMHLHMKITPNIFPQQSWMFLANLAYGVTTACDPSSNFDSFGYTELLESGQMIGPRLYTVGRAARFSDGLLKCDNINDARSLVKKRAQLGGNIVKQYELPSRLQRQWLLMACKEAGLNMTNEGYEDPILQIAMIKDGSTGIEHNPVWGNIYADIINLVARSKTFLTPTLQMSYGVEPAKEYFKYKYWRSPDKKLIHFTPSITQGEAESLGTIKTAQPKDTSSPGFLYPSQINAKLYRKGAHLVLGSHGNNQGIGVHNEMWALQMGGLTNLEVLQIATIEGAKALGIYKDVGSIEVGKIADLIVLKANPLEDIHNSREIHYVMKDGVLYDGYTLDQLWPEKKKCPDWILRSPK